VFFRGRSAVEVGPGKGAEVPCLQVVFFRGVLLKMDQAKKEQYSMAFRYRSSGGCC
jgi:hypothetical protein